MGSGDSFRRFEGGSWDCVARASCWRKAASSALRCFSAFSRFFSSFSFFRWASTAASSASSAQRDFVLVLIVVVELGVGRS